VIGELLGQIRNGDEDREPPYQEQHKTPHGEEGKKSVPEPFFFFVVASFMATSIC
jgi:hypothetical protein